MWPALQWAVLLGRGWLLHVSYQSTFGLNYYAFSFNALNIVTVGEYSGVAPDAKLCVEDLTTGSNICNPSAKQMVQGPYSAGSRVFSNSWNSFYPNNVGYYDSYDIDNYLYKHQVRMLFHSLILNRVVNVFRQFSRVL